MKQQRKIYDVSFKTKALELSNEKKNISYLASKLSL